MWWYAKDVFSADAVPFDFGLIHANVGVSLYIQLLSSLLSMYSTLLGHGIICRKTRFPPFSDILTFTWH